MVAVLELFCGAGLATRGLIRAGAREVYGFDIRPQPRFPGPRRKHDGAPLRFFQCDVTDPKERGLLDALAEEVDFIWASPPCQFGSALRHAPNAKQHRNLIPWTRDFLRSTGKPYCIENVKGARAHLIDPIMLCGSMFGLGVLLGEDNQWFDLERERYFETSWKMRQPRTPIVCPSPPVIGVYGSHARVRAASVPGGRGTAWPFAESQSYAAAHALGVAGEGLTLAEMSQGIPPAYSRHILNSWKRSRRE